MAFKIGQNAILGAQGLALFYIGGSQIIEGSLSVGMLVAFTSYAMTFATRVTSLFDLCSDAKMIGVHTTRLNDILQAAPTEPSSGPRSVPVVQRIAFRNIAFRYADSQPWILKDVSLDITAGESIAIVGPSGCGKSTLGKIILGLERPTSGEIFLDDVPLATFGFANFRGIMAAVLQEDVLLAGTVSQNIAFSISMFALPRSVPAQRLRAWTRISKRCQWVTTPWWVTLAPSFPAARNSAS